MVQSMSAQTELTYAFCAMLSTLYCFEQTLMKASVMFSTGVLL